MSDYRYSHLASASATDVGRKRAQNEDSHVRLADHGVFLVADGMGGAAGGEIASRAVVEAVQKAFDRPGDGATPHTCEAKVQRVQAALNEASRWICEYAEKHSAKGMGTTVVALVFDGDAPARALAVHAGDSRAYRYRDGALAQISRDHSLAEAMGAKDENAIAPHLRSVITRAVGISPTVELERTPVDVRPEDLFLVCSDGLTRMISDEQIARRLEPHAQRPLPELIESLIRDANEAGGKDNITVILVKAGQQAAHPGPEEASPTRAPAEHGVSDSRTSEWVVPAATTGTAPPPAPPPPRADAAPGQAPGRSGRKRVAVGLGVALGVAAAGALTLPYWRPWIPWPLPRLWPSAVQGPAAGSHGMGGAETLMGVEEARLTVGASIREAAASGKWGDLSAGIENWMKETDAYLMQNKAAAGGWLAGWRTASSPEARLQVFIPRDEDRMLYLAWLEVWQRVREGGLDPAGQIRQARAAMAEAVPGLVFSGSQVPAQGASAGELADAYCRQRYADEAAFVAATQQRAAEWAQVLGRLRPQVAQALGDGRTAEAGAALSARMTAFQGAVEGLQGWVRGAQDRPGPLNLQGANADVVLDLVRRAAGAEADVRRELAAVPPKPAVAPPAAPAEQPPAQVAAPPPAAPPAAPPPREEKPIAQVPERPAAAAQPVEPEAPARSLLDRQMERMKAEAELLPKSADAIGSEASLGAYAQFLARIPEAESRRLDGLAALVIERGAGLMRRYLSPDSLNGDAARRIAAACPPLADAWAPVLDKVLARDASGLLELGLSDVTPGAAGSQWRREGAPRSDSYDEALDWLRGQMLSARKQPAAPAGLGADEYRAAWLAAMAPARSRLALAALPGEPGWPVCRVENASPDEELALERRVLGDGQSAILTNAAWGTELAYTVRDRRQRVTRRTLKLDPPGGIRALCRTADWDWKSAASVREAWRPYLGPELQGALDIELRTLAQRDLLEAMRGGGDGRGLRHAQGLEDAWTGFGARNAIGTLLDAADEVRGMDTGFVGPREVRGQEKVGPVIKNHLAVTKFTKLWKPLDDLSPQFITAARDEAWGLIENRLYVRFENVFQGLGDLAQMDRDQVVWEAFMLAQMVEELTGRMSACPPGSPLRGQLEQFLNSSHFAPGMVATAPGKEPFGKSISWLAPLIEQSKQRYYRNR